MSILKKLSGELNSKERSEKANEEINQVLVKYGCIMDIRQSIVIVPLEPKKSEDDKAREDYRKA